MKRQTQTYFFCIRSPRYPLLFCSISVANLGTSMSKPLSRNLCMVAFGVLSWAVSSITIHKVYFITRESICHVLFRKNGKKDCRVGPFGGVYPECRRTGSRAGSVGLLAMTMVQSMSVRNRSAVLRTSCFSQ